MSVFFIAEAGVNHNGDPEMAVKLVEAAAWAGADAVKFQTFIVEKSLGRHTEKAEYQKTQTGGGSQYDMVKPLEMSHDLHRRLFDRAGELGIEFMSTAFDDESADFLIGLGIRRVKIPSGEITNFPFLRQLAGFGLPIIMSTGMATLDEIFEALSVLEEARRERGFSEPLKEMVTILHCTSDYPAAISDANLRAMRTIAEATGHPVGYSDHTLGSIVSTAAVAMGAQIIEKHLTLDFTLPGPDHRASAEPELLKHLISQIRQVELALGSARKEPTEAEMNVRMVARRSVAAARDLPGGRELSVQDLAIMRPGTGIPPKQLEEVVGRRLKEGLVTGSPVTWANLE
jgi:N,N'-diacetyllegionaminate synthase